MEKKAIYTRKESGKENSYTFVLHYENENDQLEIYCSKCRYTSRYKARKAGENEYSWIKNDASFDHAMDLCKPL